ncbi:hypothetical protein [Pandoraea sputorum]|uniref:Uncharacterized protein n=1 Tax=Pandoraea sputorum TaxID=93222 RepID=A0A5E5AP95_9BURK|nr:hypothetical protein [Pandoraea sputorum]VVE74886.1 hypothetical protein PSP31121_00353 [Pandoraea sputorum]
MSHVSHHRAIGSAPCYRLSPTANRRQSNRFGAHEFPRHFRGTRASPRAHVVAANGPCRNAPGKASSIGHWQSAFALTVVANLVPLALAGPRLPVSRDEQRPGDDAAEAAALHAHDIAAISGDHVQRDPVQQHAALKGDYSLPQLLRALGASRAPFQNLGRAINEIHILVSGEELDPETLDTVKEVGSFIDMVTALIPSVQNARLGGHVAQAAAEATEGKPTNAERIGALIQMSDPRALGASMPVQAGAPSADLVPSAWLPAEPAAPAHEIHEIGRPGDDGGVEPNVAEDVIAVASADARAQTNIDAQDGKPVSVVNDDIPARDPLDPPVDAPETPRDDHDRPVNLPEHRIDGERDHLRGYEQALPPGAQAESSHPQLFTIDTRHYLGGEAGFYRLSTTPQANHWLVDAPRGTRAQVPVIYDPQTGQWQAQAPLRLCGGGCGPSRASTPDSIAMSRNQIGDAIRHIPDRDVRDAIQLAYRDLSHLHLMRSNREDLRPFRDNSIVGHRQILVPQLMRLDPYSTLFEQQREAAEITTIHYDTYVDTGVYNLSPEAFCQENAEILFHYLLARGVPSHHIRIMTVQPKNQPAHVMVLYTESDQFIDLLDLSTPQPPVQGYVDGISAERFTAALFLTRDVTVLLDPWSRVKASSFVDTDSIEAMMHELDIALADTGHRPGNPFRVSLTRPYPAPRDRALARRPNPNGSRVSQGSQGSGGSQGSKDSGGDGSGGSDASRAT